MPKILIILVVVLFAVLILFMVSKFMCEKMNGGLYGKNEPYTIREDFINTVIDNCRRVVNETIAYWQNVEEKEDEEVVESFKTRLNSITLSPRFNSYAFIFDLVRQALISKARFFGTIIDGFDHSVAGLTAALIRYHKIHGQYMSYFGTIKYWCGIFNNTDIYYAAHKSVKGPPMEYDIWVCNDVDPVEWRKLMWNCLYGEEKKLIDVDSSSYNSDYLTIRESYGRRDTSWVMFKRDEKAFEWLYYQIEKIIKPGFASKNFTTCDDPEVVQEDFINEVIDICCDKYDEMGDERGKWNSGDEFLHKLWSGEKLMIMNPRFKNLYHIYALVRRCLDLSMDNEDFNDYHYIERIPGLVEALVNLQIKIVGDYKLKPKNIYWYHRGKHYCDIYRVSVKKVGLFDIYVSYYVDDIKHRQWDTLMTKLQNSNLSFLPKICIRSSNNERHYIRDRKCEHISRWAIVKRAETAYNLMSKRQIPCNQEIKLYRGFDDELDDEFEAYKYIIMYRAFMYMYVMAYELFENDLFYGDWSLDTVGYDFTQNSFVLCDLPFDIIDGPTISVMTGELWHYPNMLLELTDTFDTGHLKKDSLEHRIIPKGNLNFYLLMIYIIKLALYYEEWGKSMNDTFDDTIKICNIWHMDKGRLLFYSPPGFAQFIEACHIPKDRQEANEVEPLNFNLDSSSFDPIVQNILQSIVTLDDEYE